VGAAVTEELGDYRKRRSTGGALIALGTGGGGKAVLTRKRKAAGNTGGFARVSQIGRNQFSKRNVSGLGSPTQ